MPRVYCPGVVERWLTPTLEGRIVRLEPLAQKHADDLWEASRDPRVWRWLPIVQPQTRDEWQGWMDDALARVEDGLDLAFATVLVANGQGGRLDALPGAAARAPKPRDRLDLAGTVGVGHRRQHGGQAAPARVRLRRRSAAAASSSRPTRSTSARGPRWPASRPQFEGIHRKHMLVRDGQNRDSAWYSVVDDEWPIVREALRAAGRSGLIAVRSAARVVSSAI